ncbi:hypothetical protein EJ05DRAFT_466840 [Pseudovirgaria hyperparasitica]|uniref:(4-O-methyl)-D-glucuronate--lignin esterase n=1 Tax=Pseudovirgaria hyperparasitica TaxID=470096 RepID=A0A6A6W391_9PEZI|nr:uncharacterized protein EJ05DRAFT_466840 [Pseudovirgaria hyperparasitica]KAF2756484.1 hypothetical protein EJ05DRAFT_466840 [Pseudovirgaria hyperparasitica]
MILYTAALLLLHVVCALAHPASLSSRQTTCTLPSNFTPPSTSKLPNPFIFASGRSVTTKADWACRQQELSQLFQKSELGDKPAKPSSLSASLSNNILTITAREASTSISFTVTIQKPPGPGPFPAIITLGQPSIPIPPSSIATIILDNDAIAAQSDLSSRGHGLFYSLYGPSHSAGALIAWSWAVSRILDALALVAPTSAIDPLRIGVTGCSRNAKGAFVAGAFDERIALTLPQESGAGGASCWRIADSEAARGKNIQTAAQIVRENAWFSARFDGVAALGTARLPVDHHELAALVAPRGLYVMENDIEWLGPVATTGCGIVGRRVYAAVGAADAMGFSLVGGHAHCQFPEAQRGELMAFMSKYLLEGNASTAGVERSSAVVNVADWMDWVAPVLT